MHLRDHPGTAAGILLACIAAHYAVSDRARSGPREATLPDVARATLPLPGSPARTTLDWCRENVAIVADVSWASACAAVAGELRQRRSGCSDASCAFADEAADDSPDCTLPDDRARPLNAARAKAEQMCLDDALASARQAR